MSRSPGSYRWRNNPIFLTLGFWLRAGDDTRKIGIFAVCAYGTRNLGRVALFFLCSLVASMALTSGFTLTLLSALGSWHSNDAFSGW